MVYEQRADALKAKSQFNDVALDGQPMKIEMVESQGSERMLSSGIRCAANAACAYASCIWSPQPLLTHLWAGPFACSLVLVPLLGKPQTAGRYRLASGVAAACCEVRAHWLLAETDHGPRRPAG